VTLYGIVDGGFTYTSNQGGKSNYQATAGSEQGSRWGFSARKIWAVANAAIFRLENGFNLQTGVASANGRMFGRQAWVGLLSDKWGAVKRSSAASTNAAQDSLEPLQVSADTSQYGTASVRYRRPEQHVPHR